MSASRTLRRKLKSDQDRRLLPENRPVKGGTPFKAQRHLDETGGYETYLHATKGWRCKRLAA